MDDSISKLANVSVNYGNKTISFDKVIVNFEVDNDPELSFKTPVFLSTETLLAPVSDKIVQGTLYTMFPNKWTFFICDDSQLRLPYGIAVEKTIMH